MVVLVRLRWIERGELIAERQRVALLLDDRSDVVALQGNREVEELAPLTVLQFENVA